MKRLGRASDLILEDCQRAKEYGDFQAMSAWEIGNAVARAFLGDAVVGGGIADQDRDARMMEVGNKDLGDFRMEQLRGLGIRERGRLYSVSWLRAAVRVALMFTRKQAEEGLKAGYKFSLFKQLSRVNDTRTRLALLSRPVTTVAALKKHITDQAPEKRLTPDRGHPGQANAGPGGLTRSARRRLCPCPACSWPRR
jgi:hypothetical protein